MYYKNLIGKTFHDWTVIDICSESKGSTKVLCRCKCGNTKPVDTYTLTHNGSKSCGKCNTYFDDGEYMRCVMKNGTSFIFVNCKLKLNIFLINKYYQQCRLHQGMLQTNLPDYDSPKYGVDAG